MATKRRFPVNGKEMDAVEVAFDPVKEVWNEYELADGGRIRMRLTVQRIYQILDEEGKPARNPAGDRILVVESQNQLVTTE